LLSLIDSHISISADSIWSEPPVVAAGAVAAGCAGAALAVCWPAGWK
jgi:hypothetical protein